MKRAISVISGGEEGIENNHATKRVCAPKSSSVRVMSCRRPAFRGQSVYTQSGTYVLSAPSVNTSAADASSTATSLVAATSSPEPPASHLPSCVILLHDVLSVDERAAFQHAAMDVERRSGRSGFGMKPRLELCYTPDGQPYKYSGKKHFTTHIPTHVSDAIPSWLSMLDKQLLTVGFQNPYKQMSTAVDILYDASFAQGGSIGRHKDNEAGWGLVLIFTLGQTRWLRVRNEFTGAWHNVEARDNSLIAMLGPRFQQDYTHQVDKLAKGEEVGARLSLNVRFLKEASK